MSPRPRDPSDGLEELRPLPSMWRAALLVVLFALRRNLNRLRAWRRTPPALRRGSTARKPPITGVWGVAVLGLLMCCGVKQSMLVVHDVALAAERDRSGSAVLLWPVAMQSIVDAEDRTQARVNAGSISELEREILQLAFVDDATHDGAYGEEGVKRARQLMLRFDQRGSAGFRARATGEESRPVDLESEAAIVVGQWTLLCMQQAERSSASVLRAAASEAQSREALRQAFIDQARKDRLSGASEVEARADQLMQVFDEQGRAGFQERRLRPWSQLRLATQSWYGGSDAPEMLRPLGLLALLLSLSCALASVVAGDLAKVGWHLEWWFTFPVHARGLLLARALETAVSTPLTWLLLPSFFGTVFLCAGHGWLAVVLAVAATLYVGLMGGGLRVVLEMGLRRYLSLRNVARFQAVALVVALLLLTATAASRSPQWLQSLTRFAQGVPAQLLLSPLSPISWAAGGSQAWVSAVACAGAACLVVLGGVSLGGWFVRDGLTTSTGPHQGRRMSCPKHVQEATATPSALAAPKQRRMGSVAHKELLLLFRDRRLLAQAFGLPLVVLGLQLLGNGQLAPDLSQQPRDAAALAFAMAALMLATGAVRTLTQDVPALWLYFTVPKALERLLLEKALFWSGLASCMAALTLVITTRASPSALWTGAPMFALVLVGVVLSAFIATGIGVLATDTLASEPRPRVAASMLNLNLLLTLLFFFTLYADSWWDQLIHVALLLLLVFALWQKVREHAPFLLDPQATPKPVIAVADGVIAALVFFVVAALLVGILRIFRHSPGASMVFGFAGGGLATATGTLLVLSRAGVPRLRAKLGLAMPRNGLARGLATGVAGGLLAALLAVGYIALMTQVELLRRLHDDTLGLAPADLAPDRLFWLALAALLAAPLFEEFVFRGLLYAGFRHTLRPFQAMLASALIFAVLHPPIAVLPVFVVGCVCAVTYERSRSLLVPMAAHMAYNAVIIGRDLWP